MKKKELMLVSSLFIAGLLLRLVFFDTSYFFWDEAVYLLNAETLAGVTTGYNELAFRPIIVSSLIALFQKISSDWLVMSKVALTLLNSLAIVIMYYIGKLHKKKTGLIAAAITAILPLSIKESRFLMTDHLAAVFALATIMFLLYYMKNKQKWQLILAGVTASLAYQTKFTMIIMVLVIGVGIYLVGKERLENSLYAAGAYVAALIPYAVWSTINLGNPWAQFMNAFFVVQQSDIMGILRLLALFMHMLGPVLLIGLIITWYLKRKTKLSTQERFLYVTTAIVTLVSIFVLFRGISKPELLPWEPERFLILTAFLVIAIVARTVIEIYKKNKHLYFIVGLIVVLFLFQYPSIYEPAINKEDGLRKATLEMAGQLNHHQVQEFACLGNCPPLAYYTKAKMRPVYSEQALLASEDEWLVAYKRLDKEIFHKECLGRHCAYLYWNKPTSSS